MKLTVAIQMDHVSTIDIDGDSTFVLGLEAERRGYAVWHYTPPDLIFRDRKVLARAQPMKLRREKGNHFTLGAAEMLDLATLDVVLLRLENNVRLRLAKREDWPAAAQSLERMLAIAPDRPELLFEAGQLNARLDKRRAAIAAFERFLDIEGQAGDPDLRRQASSLLQELRRGLN